MKNFEVIRKVMVMVALMMFVLLVGCGKKEEEDKNETGVTEDVSIGDENTESDDLDESLFKLTDTMYVMVESDGKEIVQTDEVNGNAYTLTLNLEKAAGYTSVEQLVTCTKVFWYCYPKMYEKMAVENTPRAVNLLVENEGYEIAEAWGCNVHLYDQWLYDHPEDFDCLTHELAHIIQTDWGGEYSPQYEGDAYLIERFADACRYMYAYEGGLYNDRVWELQTPDVESHYSTSSRFWVWVQRTFSTDEADIFKRLVEHTQIFDESHAGYNWENDGPMWGVIFEGTQALGKSLDELWDEFLESDFAWN